MQQVDFCNGQLNSEDDREKEQACRTISTLVLDETEGPQALELLIAHSGLQNLLQLLMIPDQDVRVAAAGALRNVSLAGAETTATKLVNLDCLTLLFEGILLPLGQPGATQPNPEFLIHTLSLLANLAEYEERVAERFAGTWPAGVLTQAADFLNIVTDENEAMEGQASDEARERLQRVAVESTDPLLRATLYSVLYNVRLDDLVAAEILIPLLLPMLDPLTPAWEQAINDFLNGPKDAKSLGTLRFQMEVLKKQAGGLQMALEVAANICNDPEQDMEASDEDRPPSALALLVQATGLVTAVLPLCTATWLQLTESVPPPAAELTTPYHNLFLAVQKRALSALCNMIILLPHGAVEIQATWRGICDLCYSPLATDMEFLETLASVLWALLRQETAEDLGVSQSDCQGVLGLLQAPVPVRVIALQLLSLLLQEECFPGLAAVFAQATVQQLRSDSDARVLAAALSSLFDNYDNNQALFDGHNIRELLLALAPPFEQQFLALNEAGELSGSEQQQIEDALTNLRPFLEHLGRSKRR